MEDIDDDCKSMKDTIGVIIDDIVNTIVYNEDNPNDITSNEAHTDQQDDEMLLYPLFDISTADDHNHNQDKIDTTDDIISDHMKHKEVKDIKDLYMYVNSIHANLNEQSNAVIELCKLTNNLVASLSRLEKEYPVSTTRLNGDVLVIESDIKKLKDRVNS